MPNGKTRKRRFKFENKHNCKIKKDQKKKKINENSNNIWQRFKNEKGRNGNEINLVAKA
jgi:hypothetical protein